MGTGKPSARSPQASRRLVSARGSSPFEIAEGYLCFPLHNQTTDMPIDGHSIARPAAGDFAMAPRLDEQFCRSRTLARHCSLRGSHATPSLGAATEQCVLMTAGVLKPLPEKEI
jgi:hypothetical protein